MLQNKRKELAQRGPGRSRRALLGLLLPLQAREASQRSRLPAGSSAGCLTQLVPLLCFEGPACNPVTAETCGFSAVKLGNASPRPASREGSWRTAGAVGFPAPVPVSLSFWMRFRGNFSGFRQIAPHFEDQARLGAKRAVPRLVSPGTAWHGTALLHRSPAWTQDKFSHFWVAGSPR